MIERSRRPSSQAKGPFASRSLRSSNKGRLAPASCFPGWRSCSKTPNPRVRFRLALAMGDLPADEVRLHALAQLAQLEPQDPWVLSAILSSATGQVTGLVRLLAEVDRNTLANPSPARLQFLLDAGEQVGQAAGEELEAATEWAAEWEFRPALRGGRKTRLLGRHPARARTGRQSAACERGLSGVPPTATLRHRAGRGGPCDGRLAAGRRPQCRGAVDLA